jgi:hypothetical protein
MAFTIDYFYQYFLDRIDKSGSTIISPPQVMELFEVCLHDYLEEVIKYNENTQQLRDKLLPIFTPYELALTANPDNADEMLATIPEDYYYLETANVVVPDVAVRRTRLVRKGELDSMQRSPNKRPAPEYPTVIQYQDFLAVYGAPTATNIKGFYIAKPTIGDVKGNISTEILVNLPDQAVYQIVLKMVKKFKGETGDPRYQSAIIEEQSYGDKNR